MKMPGAVWIGPTPNEDPGGMTAHLGLVLHIQQGNEQGTEAWFQEQASQASSHFLNPKTGSLRQLVDTADKAWAEANGNPGWISVENEGYSGDSLTASQVDNAAHLFAWLSTSYGIPLRTTSDVTVRGLGYHAMGGKAWGNHPDCPGTPIINQRAAIVARAAAIAGAPPVKAEAAVSLTNVIAAAKHDPDAAQGVALHKSDVMPVELALVSEGLLAAEWADGSYGTKTITAYAALQRRDGYSGKDADGIPGVTTLTALGKKHGFTVNP